MSSGTPRKSANPAIPSPRASAKPAASGDKKPTKKKKPQASSAPTAPLERMSLGVPVAKMAELSEAEAKAKLEELQQQYGTLVVSFNNQQAELNMTQKRCLKMEERVAELEAQAGGDASKSDPVQRLQEQLAATVAELRASESHVMALQKKVNKMQVEHVSEEEVDQLFYALELKEQQLAEETQKNKHLEEEVLTARQLSARGGQVAPQVVEIHHHNDLSDEEDDDAPAPAAA